MPGYKLVTRPSVIPVPGGKTIEELFGRVNTGTEAFSLAHMVAPGGWEEPPQTPEFGELTVMVRGRMRLEVEGEAIDLEAGHAVWTEPGVRVRFSNPFDDEAEYFAVCIPAFSPELANRDDEPA